MAAPSRIFIASISLEASVADLFVSLMLLTPVLNALSNSALLANIVARNGSVISPTVNS